MPLTVVCSDRPCGARGDCLDGTNGSQVCVCDTGYTGAFCASCVDGYQDNDNDGICQESCGVAPVACQGAAACSDESGEARCVCTGGLTGPNCGECEPGYRHDASGEACVATCAAPDFDCEGTCVETLQGARCECEPGHAGPSCDECDEAHAVDAEGNCVAPLPEDALFWTIARTDKQSYLGALVSPGFDFVPIVPIADDVTDLVYDSAGDVLYGVSSGSLVTIDPGTGETASALDDASGLGRAVTRDPTTGLLFVASDETIWSADLVSGEVLELSTPGARSLAFDAARHMLLGVTATGERIEIDPSDGSQRTLSALAEMESLGLAVDASLGRAYALGALPELPEQKLARLCADVAEGFGLPRTTRELVVEFGNPLAAGETRVLSDRSAGPPLVAYGSLEGSLDGGTLRVETAHPDAVVCIVTEREPLEVVVTETALFQLLVVVSDENTISLSVDDAFTAPGAAIRARGDISVSGPADRVTTYTNEEWAALGLSTWATTPDVPQSVLGLVDWRSGASSFVELGGPPIAGGLTLVGVR